MLHLEVLDDKRIDLLNRITQQIKPFGFYLAGGTALSLQTGYRISEDFDFFTQRHFNEYTLAEALSHLCEHFQIVLLEKDTCDLILDGVKVSLFYYPYPLLEDLCDGSIFPCLTLAGKKDIACMKLIAIGQRGARRDFFDLYHLILDEQYTASALLDLLQEKYGDINTFTNIGMGLSYFEDAENDALPSVFIQDDWKETKRFFTKLSRQFIREGMKRAERQ